MNIQLEVLVNLLVLLTSVHVHGRIINTENQLISRSQLQNARSKRNIVEDAVGAMAAVVVDTIDLGAAFQNTAQGAIGNFFSLFSLASDRHLAHLAAIDSTGLIDDNIEQ